MDYDCYYDIKRNILYKMRYLDTIEKCDKFITNSDKKLSSVKLW